MKQTAAPQQLQFRSRLIHGVRQFFHGRDYVEVETPLLSPDIIPEAHIDPIRCGEFFLPASPEIFMKRLLAAGHDRIFQICKCFRKEERGSRHLPEFTMLEWYGKGETYAHLMEQCEALVGFLAQELGMGQTLNYQGKTINIGAPFERLTVADAFETYTDTDCWTALAEDRFDELISFEIEPHLGWEKPVFLYDYPKPLASLAALVPENPDMAQRCELYMAGIELANGFTELTDAPIQAQRFEEENRIREELGKEALPLPRNFLTDLERMPEAAGIALGLDRLIMLFADASDIDQVTAFTPEA